MAKFDESAQPNFRAALNKKTLQAYELIEIIIDVSDPDLIFRLTNAPRDITYDGNLYYAVGAVLQFSEVEETQVFGITEVTVSLAGIPLHDLRDTDTGEKRNLISEFLEYKYVDKPLRIYRAYMDNDTLITDSGTPAVLQLFDGRIDNPAIEDTENDSTVIALKASSHWVDFERRGGRRTNENEQRNTRNYADTAFFNDDRIFEFAHDALKDIKWKE